MVFQGRVHALQTLSMTPSIGAMLGTRHSDAVLQRLQAQSGGQVIFGQEGNPYATGYQSLMAIIQHQEETANKILRQVVDTVTEPDKYIPVTSVNDMYYVTPVMQEVIITYPPVRQLLETGRIYGYGIDPKNLPDEDVYGRILDNGKSTSDDTIKPMTWMWRTDDPKLTDTDLVAIQETRDWIDQFLLVEMEKDGQYRDPTDPANKIRRKPNKK